jgi:AcrR family transcriptional regulator
MSGPALYRYVRSRDELMADLVVQSWEGLASALERAAEENSRASAAKRLGAIGLAYRAWALAQPHSYRLAVQTRLGSGELAPERVIPAAQRSMAVILEAIDGLPDARKPKAKVPAELRAELETWIQRVGGQRLPTATLLRGVSSGPACTAWSAWSSITTWPRCNSTPSSSTEPSSPNSAPRPRPRRINRFARSFGRGWAARERNCRPQVARGSASCFRRSRSRAARTAAPSVSTS